MLLDDKIWYLDVYLLNLDVGNNIIQPTTFSQRHQMQAFFKLFAASNDLIASNPAFIKLI